MQPIDSGGSRCCDAMTPAQIAIHTFGGVRRVAKVVGVHPATVLRWRNGRVPIEHMEKLITAAHRSGKRLLLAELVFGRTGLSQRIIRIENRTVPATPMGDMVRVLAGSENQP